MEYRFDVSHPRIGMEAIKWDSMGEQSEEIVPLSVADMELLSPPEIIEEMKKHGGVRYVWIYMVGEVLWQCCKAVDEGTA